LQRLLDVNHSESWCEELKLIFSGAMPIYQKTPIFGRPTERFVTKFLHVFKSAHAADITKWSSVVNTTTIIFYSNRESGFLIAVFR